MKSGWRGWVPWFAACLVASACASQTVRSTYAEEFDCQSEVDVEDLGSGRFRVSGCNKTVLYVCRRSVCDSERPPDSSPPASAPSTKATTTETSVGVAHLEKNKSGASVVLLELRLDAETLLKLRGSPALNKPVALQLVRLGNDDSKPDCELAAMINGQRVALPKPEQKPLSGEATDGRTLSTRRSELSPALVHELTVARQFALKTCQSRWSVSEEGVAELRHFAQLYEEDQAWQRPDSESGTGGLLAPSGGWPAWSVVGKFSCARRWRRARSSGVVQVAFAVRVQSRGRLSRRYLAGFGCRRVGERATDQLPRAGGRSERDSAAGQAQPACANCPRQPRCGSLRIGRFRAKSEPGPRGS